MSFISFLSSSAVARTNASRRKVEYSHEDRKRMESASARPSGDLYEGRPLDKDLKTSRKLSSADKADAREAHYEEYYAEGAEAARKKEAERLKQIELEIKKREAKELSRREADKRLERAKTKGRDIVQRDRYKEKERAKQIWRDIVNSILGVRSGRDTEEAVANKIKDMLAFRSSAYNTRDFLFYAFNDVMAEKDFRSHMSLDLFVNLLGEHRTKNLFLILSQDVKESSEIAPRMSHAERYFRYMELLGLSEYQKKRAARRVSPIRRASREPQMAAYVDARTGMASTQRMGSMSVRERPAPFSFDWPGSEEEVAQVLALDVEDSNERYGRKPEYRVDQQMTGQAKPSAGLISQRRKTMPSDVVDYKIGVAERRLKREQAAAPERAKAERRRELSGVKEAIEAEQLRFMPLSAGKPVSVSSKYDSEYEQLIKEHEADLRKSWLEASKGVNTATKKRERLEKRALDLGQDVTSESDWMYHEGAEAFARENPKRRR